ncbi:MAG TPA: hypothetical protein VGP63_22795 [Planctomycetaceae bacterium]|jgi:hypothetical protein|nr:hypothetical protein [Planctomycetaceae bacterium]
MKFDEWIIQLPIQSTPKGARLDLRLYVYPDGHGNFCVQDKTGNSVTNPQPVNNPVEAREVLENIWNRAMSVKTESDTSQQHQPTLAEQFADVIGTVPDLPADMAMQHDRYVHGTAKS